ncbi:hypothetical protein [Chitinibacter sp. S2-10]|uniref:hypothetical protein n=1 Tax=Chitinibacter sp. S2-10 TaxID=3373597 RepID=UPI003977AD62
MKTKLAVCSAAILMFSVASMTFAEGESASDAQTNTTSETQQAKPEIIIAKGKAGQTPVQLVYDYLAERVSDEYGIGEYRQLSISQKTLKAEDYKNIALELQQSGLADDAITKQRFQFALGFNDETGVWQIKSVKQDWQCRRHTKKWTQRPCQ